MKIQYILLLLVTMVSLQIRAVEQEDAMPILPMNSTSAMVGCGSDIPLAAEEGTFVYDKNIITIDKAPAGPRRVSWDDDDPMDLVPLGATPWMLMLLLCLGYVLMNYCKRREKI